MERKGNKGFTLIELLVTVAILSIVLTGVTSIMVTGSKTFAKGNADADMQAQAQLVVNQIEDMVIDTNGGLDYLDYVDTRELILYNAIDAEDGSGTDYIKESVKWVAAEQKLYYSKWQVVPEEGTGDYVEGTAYFTDQFLADKVSDFAIDLSDTRKEYGKKGEIITIVQSVQITVGCSADNGNVAYATSPVITLRNRMMLSNSPKKIFENTPTASDTMKLYIASTDGVTLPRMQIQDRVTTVEQNRTYQLYAMLNAGNDVNAYVNWKIVDTGTASTISEDGVLSVGELETSEYLLIVATYKNNPNKTARGVVKVKRSDKTLDDVVIQVKSLEPFNPVYTSLVFTTGFTEEELATDLEYTWTVNEPSWVTFTNGNLQSNAHLSVVQSRETYNQLLKITLTVYSKSLKQSLTTSVFYPIPRKGDVGDAYIERGKYTFSYYFAADDMSQLREPFYIAYFCDVNGERRTDLDDLIPCLQISPRVGGFDLRFTSPLPINVSYYIKVMVYCCSQDNTKSYDYERIFYVPAVELYGKDTTTQWKQISDSYQGIHYNLYGYYSPTLQNGDYELTLEEIDSNAPEGATIQVNFQEPYIVDAESNSMRSEVTFSVSGDLGEMEMSELRVNSIKVKISNKSHPEIFAYSTLTFTE